MVAAVPPTSIPVIRPIRLPSFSVNQSVLAGPGGDVLRPRAGGQPADL